MGLEAAKVIRARQRAVAARVDRLIAERERHTPIDSARRERIKVAVRDGRRAMRTLTAAQGAVQDVEARVGAALARIAAEGLSLSQAYEALGLTRSVGRRLVQIVEDAAGLPADADTSTDPTSGTHLVRPGWPR
jgi:hypothetical protein